MPDDQPTDQHQAPPVALFLDLGALSELCLEFNASLIAAAEQVKSVAAGFGDLRISLGYSSPSIKASILSQVRNQGYHLAFSGERGLKKEATQYAKDRPKWTCVVAGNVGTVVPLGEKLRALGRNAVIIADTRPGEKYVVNIGPPFFPLEQIAKGIEGSAHRDVVQADFQEPRKRESLRIFLCHSSSDKPAIRALDGRLRNDGFHPWLDEVDLLPGQDWEHEISAAVRNSGVVLVCLSRASTTREGFVQKEIKYALDVADEKPEGTIFIIPVRLEECVVPARLGRWHWVNLFEDNGYNRLLAALRSRHQSTAGQG